MIITLLTDFGTEDYFVGAMKGAILSINRQAKIFDITHEIAPQDINSAAFTLLNYYKTFPPHQTIHVCVVDPGVGSERGAILVETENYFFVAPDNGLLSFVLAEEKISRAVELTNEKFFRHPVSNTFHGRDIFSPVAAHISKGVSPKEFGREIKDFLRFESIKPKLISKNEIEAEIIHIDHFGNLITNLKAEDLPPQFVLQINEHRIENFRRHFSEADAGEVFSIIGSAGFLETVAFMDSAKRLLNVKIKDRVFVTKTGN